MLKLVLLGVMTVCQTPAVPVSDAIHFWPEVKAPTPIPVSPDAATVLHAGDTAIFDSNVEMFFRVIPDGVVKVKRVAGPKSYFYTDDKGEVIEKDFAGKFLLVLTPAKSGTCQIVIVPKGVTDDKKITTRLIECQLAPKPPPDPIIPDPPKPDALTGLAKSAFDWASACQSPTRAKDAAALAKNFRTVASAQAAGVYVNVASMSNELRVLNQTALETDDLWRPAFFVPLNAELTKSVKTLAEYGAACKEVAKGLEAIR